MAEARAPRIWRAADDRLTWRQNLFIVRLLFGLCHRTAAEACREAPRIWQAPLPPAYLSHRVDPTAGSALFFGLSKNIPCLTNRDAVNGPSDATDQ
jgi:hypothetical protein